MADEAVEIKVNADALYLDDLEALEGRMGMTALVDVLDRCVAGGVRGRKIPLKELRSIGKAIQEALTADLGN